MKSTSSSFLKCGSSAKFAKACRCGSVPQRGFLLRDREFALPLFIEDSYFYSSRRAGFDSGASYFGGKTVSADC